LFVALEIERNLIMAKKSNLTIAQRREVVLSLIRREEPAVQLARRWGVSEPTLYRWRDEFMAGGEAALANGRGRTDGRAREIQELQSQIEGRDQVIGELTVANRILKKLSGDCA
jgi:transposase-like protein